MPLHSSLSGADLHDPKGKYPTALSLDDNQANAYLIEDSAGNDYLVITTTNSGELVLIGNATTNPTFYFLGSGRIEVGTGGVSLTEGSNPSTLANRGTLYTKDVATNTELFYKDSNGNVIQLTTLGGLFVPRVDRAETITGLTITGTDTALTTLANTPISNASVKVFLNGVLLEEGAGRDYTISGAVITLLANSGVAPDIVAADRFRVIYQSAS
ncbi:MAG: hypothetical protein RL139_1566 [Gemmatimonadota bacterium]|jgi:hypothetical protein